MSVQGARLVPESGRRQGWQTRSPKKKKQGGTPNSSYEQPAGTWGSIPEKNEKNLGARAISGIGGL